MKRYRVMAEDFDTSATLLSMTIEEHWDEDVKQGWRETKQQILDGLAHTSGAHELLQKAANLTELGPAPFSVIAFHNRFMRQARQAFVIGAYYPALTSACALGERILNHLVLRVRDHYKHTVEYQKVYGKSSFQDWEKVISVLESWGVFSEGVAANFRELMKLRHQSLHFNPETDTKDRELARNALTLLTTIVREQLGTWGTRWFFAAEGASFLKLSAESEPFVREIFLPRAMHVGPDHRMECDEHRLWRAVDRSDYPERQVTDDEFAALYKASLERDRSQPANV